MRKFYITLFLLSFFSITKAQWLWEYGGGIGISNYLGDVGGKEKTRRDFVADMQLAETRWNGTAFVRYKWRPKLSLKLSFDYLRIQGDDALSTNPGRRYRNFNFRNDIFELAFTGEWFFYENNDLGNTYRYRNGFRAYLMGGVGAFYHNPKSYYRGEWVAMRPYATEGYSYSNVVLCIPMGVGFYFTFNKKHRLGMEMSFRKTFTDYLDDIHDKYPSTPPADAYTQGLILRTTELPASYKDANPGAYYSHTWGKKRGDPTNKDAYMTLNVTYSYVIRGKSSFYRSRYRGSFFGGKKRYMRKIRAKF
ncbi:MAG: hypothetical protein JSU07_08800 [Bacteroidetes bacterium]|nr:hypothetical protein [Bacteroidota bacterium]